MKNKKTGKNVSLKLLLEKPYVQIGIILAITSLCYFNTLFNDYSFDDIFLIDNQYVIKGVNGIKDIWTHAYAQTQKGANVDYRPLSLSILSIELVIFGKTPLINHAINILLYLLSLVLLYRLCISVFKLDKINPLLPLLAVLLYGVHPSHAEVVASFKNQDEIISFIFILFSALFFNKSFDGINRRTTFIYICCTLLFLWFSLLSKMVCMPFMACIILWSIYAKQYKQLKIFSFLLAGCVISILAYIALFHNYFNRDLSYNENPLMPGTDLLLRLGLAFNSLLFYLKFLFIPFPSRYYYGYNVIPLESIFNPIPLISLLIYLFLGGLLIYSIYAKKAYSYFLFCFMFLLFSYSNLLIPYTGIVSERAMFHFSFFFIIFLLIILFQFINRKNTQNKNKRFPAFFLLIYCFYVVLFSVLTILRNENWKTTLVLITHDLKYLEKSSGGNYLAGSNFYEEGYRLKPTDSTTSLEWFNSSVYHFKKSIELCPQNPNNMAYYGLGLAYRYGLSDLKNAEKNFLKFEVVYPEYKGLAKEIGSLLFLEGKFKEAVPYYEKAVKEEPDNAELLFYQALNLFNIKDMDHFLLLNAGLLKRFPETYFPYLNYGSYYIYKNDQFNLIKNLESAVDYGCKNPQVMDMLIKYHQDKNEPDLATYYEKLKNNLKTAGK